MGFEVLESLTAICPIIVHDTAKAIAMSQRLLELGVFVIGFGYPWCRRRGQAAMPDLGRLRHRTSIASSNRSRSSREF